MRKTIIYSLIAAGIACISAAVALFIIGPMEWIAFGGLSIALFLLAYIATKLELIGYQQ